MLIEETGGAAGLRDSGLLESALASAFQTFDGKELFPSKQEKAAKIGYALVSHHTVVDGNKRIGIYVMLPFRKSTAYILIRPLMRSSK
ncbi:MAG: Fic family protein [Candidatus Methanomethylophilaceae archaeon]